MPGSGSPAAPAGDYQVRRAGPADHDGVTRELGAYFAFLGEDVDADGLDHDVADWQREYDGAAGVMLVVVDPAGLVVGTAAVRLYRSYGFEEIPDYNRNPRADLWMEIRLAPGRS